MGPWSLKESNAEKSFALILIYNYCPTSAPIPSSRHQTDLRK
jgi:hypothetical protein